METKLKDLLNNLGKYISSSYNNSYKIDYYEHGNTCVSYNSLIGVFIKGKGYFFTKYHDYSKTTLKHCKKWCGMTVSERRKLIELDSSKYISDYD
jgi:hypothetical protein